MEDPYFIVSQFSWNQLETGFH